MFKQSSVAVICALVGCAILSPGAAGVIELTAFKAVNDLAENDLAISKPGFSRPLMLRSAQSSACKKCNDALDRCEKKPPYGNPRICASDYYDCIRGKKCN